MLQLGPARIGDVICFEIAYDAVVRDATIGGAQMLVVQTNNATYAGTGQPEQQLAISRLRAVEHGRSVVVAATSGISAAVAPDGLMLGQLPEMLPGSLSVVVPQREQLTIADQVGWLPEIALAMLGVLWWAMGVVSRRTGTNVRQVSDFADPDPSWSSSRRITSATTSSASSVGARGRAGGPRAGGRRQQPDGTGVIADGMADADPSVHVLHRMGRRAWRGLPRRLRLGSGTGLRGALSRWTPTAPTSQSSCRRCWTPCATPTWCSARATFPAAAS